jgi:DNA-binding MarR family transcriptional regulator
LQILDSLRNHTIKLQITGLAYGTSVSIVQARVIDEYVKRGAPRIGELVPVLGIHKSSVSRNLTGLVKAGFLKEELSKEDSRRKVYTITVKGERFLAQLRERSKAHYERDAAKLSPEEMNQLVEFCGTLAGRGESLPVLRVDGESDLMIAMRRLAYAHGFVSDNYLKTGLTVLQFVLLSEIHHEEMDLGSLCRLLKTPHSTLTERLNAMARRGWLNSTQSPHDGRLRHLQLTPQGVATLKAVERRAERTFKAALKGLSSGQLRIFENLLARYVGPKTWRPPLSKLRDLDFMEASNRELPGLRRELLAHIARQRSGYPLSGFLFSADNRTLKITCHGVECCVCEVKKIDGGRFVLVNYLNRSTSSGMFGTKRALVSLLSQILGRPVDIGAKWQAVIDNRSVRRNETTLVKETEGCC